MKFPTKNDVGRRVIYRPAGTDCLGERGKIKSIRHPYVRVLFDGDTTPKACTPETLEFA